MVDSRVSRTTDGSGSASPAPAVTRRRREGRGTRVMILLPRAERAVRLLGNPEPMIEL